MAAAMRARARAADQAAAIEVMPENWPALRVFLAMSTQWRRAGMAGVPTGLDYAALPAVTAALAVMLDGDLLGRIKLMESAALDALLSAARASGTRPAGGRAG